MADWAEEPLPGPSPEALLALRIIPKFGDALARYAIDRHQRRLERAGEVVTTAAEALELDPGVLIEQIIEDDRLADLLNDAIQAAARSGLEAKRRALGKVLAQAVAGDDTDIDEAIMLTTSLAHLESVHVRLMAKLATARPPHRPRYWTIGQRGLAHESGVKEEVAEALLLQLHAWGVVATRIEARPFNRETDLSFKLTDHGLRLVAFLARPDDAGGTPLAP